MLSTPAAEQTADPCTMKNESHPREKWVEIRDLTIHPVAANLPMLDQKNVRFQNLCRDIAKNGVKVALFIDSKNQVLAGKHRLLCAGLSGLNQVPCIMVENLTDDEIRELILRENLERQQFSAGKRALHLVAIHEAYFTCRKARQKEALQRGKSPSGIITGREPLGKSMVMAIREFAVRYQISESYLYSAAALWDQREGKGAELIKQVWNDQSSLVAAHRELRGERKAKPDLEAQAERLAGMAARLLEKVKERDEPLTAECSEFLMRLKECVDEMHQVTHQVSSTRAFHEDSRHSKMLIQCDTLCEENPAWDSMPA